MGTVGFADNTAAIAKPAVAFADTHRRGAHGR